MQPHYLLNSVVSCTWPVFNMRVLIFALLAVTARAANYGHYSSSYPSYGQGYGSSLYGLSYGSGLGYGSGYGSGIGYGSSYGSGIGYGSSYGSGIGYGSGVSYGIGGGQGHYTTSYKPAVYTARYSGTKQYGTGAYGAGADDAGTYDTGAYDAGVYDTGAYDAGVYDTGAYNKRTYGTRGYGNVGASYKSGYASGAAPGKISFTLGGTGYQTGSSAGSQYGNVRSSAVAKPYGFYRQRTSSIRPSGVQSFTGGGAPGRISFTQDFSRVSGQSSGIHRSSGISGISTAKKTIAPVTVVRDQFTQTVVGNTRPATGSGAYGGEMSGINNEEITGIGERNSGAGYTDDGVQDIAAPLSEAVPKRPYANKAVYPIGSNQGTRTTGSHLPRISFTQDFSRVSGQSGIISNQPRIQSFNRVTSPVRPIVAPKVTSGAYGQPGIVRSSGFLGNTAAQPHIRFTQDFSRIRGQSPQFSSKPRVQSFNRVSTAVVGTNKRITTPVVRTIVQQPVVHGIDYLEKTDLHDITGGHAGVVDNSRNIDVVNFKPASVSSFDKFSTGGVSGLSRQSYGNRYGSTIRRTSPAVSGAGPAKISFTQDFSRISGHQISGIKPVISTRNEIPNFPAVLTSPVASKPVLKPFADKLVPKAPKQPIVQQPTFTTVNDQSPIQGISVGGIAGPFTADKSPFTAQPVNTGFIREHVVDYKQEVVDVGDKISDFAYAPGVEAVYDQPTSYGRVGDKSNMYVAVPVDGKSDVVHSDGISSSGALANEKGSFYEITSGNTNSGISPYAGLGQAGYSAVAPFKSYYSSSYPGYSHVSGESPRFDFSQDKSLLYTYSSPIVGSPLSYAYTSEKGQYDQALGKSIA